MPKGLLNKASESQLAAEIRKAIGAGPSEVVEVVTPQFKREPGVKEPQPPPDPFRQVKSMTHRELRDLGCRPWDEPNDEGMVLMLFPGEWYDLIPKGFKIVDINGNTESFAPKETDDDIRFGCLAYGIMVKA